MKEETQPIEKAKNYKATHYLIHNKGIKKKYKKDHPSLHQFLRGLNETLQQYDKQLIKAGNIAQVCQEEIIPILQNTIEHHLDIQQMMGNLIAHNVNLGDLKFQPHKKGYRLGLNHIDFYLLASYEV